MTKKLKVMHLIGSVSIGGAQRLALDLANHSQQQAIEVHVCTFGPVRQESFLPEFQKLPVPYHRIVSRKFYDLRVLKEVIAYVKKQEIDLIHTHLVDADIMGRLAGWISGAAVISTIHNEPKRYDSLRLDKKILNQITTRFLTSHLVAVTEDLEKQFIHEWQIPENKISAIYNAIDLAPFLSEPANRTEGEFVISNVGSLSDQKAQHILIEAALKVTAKYPNSKFLIVGRGDKKNFYQERIDELGLEKFVVLTGARKDIPQILAKTDIFVLSSFWEGLPLAAIEAMAAGCATVLTDVGGNHELIKHQENGLLVPPNDAAALADSIMALLDDRQHRQALGVAARKHVQEKFDIKLLKAQYDQLYQKIYADNR